MMGKWHRAVNLGFGTDSYENLKNEAYVAQKGAPITDFINSE